MSTIIGWRSPVRADGTIDGNWWYYSPDEPHPNNAEPIFEVCEQGWLAHPWEAT